jgi:nitroreductase
MIDRTTALRARYGEEAPQSSGPWNAVIASLLQHRSVRAYTPDAVPPGTLETMVAAAQSAASSSNMQTWSVVQVTEPAARSSLARIASNQQHIVQCPLFMVWVADLSRIERLGKTTGQTIEGLPYLETFLVAAIDAAIASQNAVAAAESMGLSTVYIGALRNDMAAVSKILGLPPGAVGVFGLCVGYADESAGPALVKPRLPQSVVVHKDRYNTTHEADGIAAYDRALEAFSAVAERSRYTWTERVISRLGRIAALAGRDRLHAVLTGLGFPLR